MTLYIPFLCLSYPLVLLLYSYLVSLISYEDPRSKLLSRVDACYSPSYCRLGCTPESVAPNWDVDSTCSSSFDSSSFLHHPSTPNVMSTTTKSTILPGRVGNLTVCDRLERILVLSVDHRLWIGTTGTTTSRSRQVATRNQRRGLLRRLPPR